jgi:hypothetical protein
MTNYQSSGRLFNISVEGYLFDILSSMEELLHESKYTCDESNVKQQSSAAILQDIVKMSEYLKIDVDSISDGASILLAAFSFFRNGHSNYIELVEKHSKIDEIIKDFEFVRRSPWHYKSQNFVILLAYITESCRQYVSLLVELATLIVNSDFKIERDEKRRLMFYQDLLREVQEYGT